METHKACRLTGHMSKLPCLGACCLATTHIHPVWFFFYFFSFFFFFFVISAEINLKWFWLLYLHICFTTHIFMSDVFILYLPFTGFQSSCFFMNVLLHRSLLPIRNKLLGQNDYWCPSHKWNASGANDIDIISKTMQVPVAAGEINFGGTHISPLI